MEAIFKNDHQNDHLEAAVQTPDGTFYKVIPSQFLWTTLPTSPGRFTFLFFLSKTSQVLYLRQIQLLLGPSPSVFVQLCSTSLFNWCWLQLANLMGGRPTKSSSSAELLDFSIFQKKSNRNYVLKSVNIEGKHCREQIDNSVQPTGKWIERISQSERALV